MPALLIGPNNRCLCRAHEDDTSSDFPDFLKCDFSISLVGFAPTSFLLPIPVFRYFVELEEIQHNDRCVSRKGLKKFGQLTSYGINRLIHN
ncbi:MAG: hypothetical protein P8165_11530 [Deltaproteobacteria bacterium]